MATRSTTRIPCTKNAQSRRQPSILRRKRKIDSGNCDPANTNSQSDSSCSRSPVAKLQCASGQDQTSASENTSPLSVIPASSSGSSSLQQIPFSSTDHSCSELSENDNPTSSYAEEIAMPSPAAPRPFRSLTCFSSPPFSITRHSPLPQLSWADHKELWEIMLQKDTIYPRNCHLLAHHSQLQPRMRAILLEWLMEVSEVYKLHRETYYLAQDFIDRYLASQKELPKQQLQLLGITCLFLASKIEEIYPPKLSEFAYVTDNACSETEIVEKELVVLKVSGGPGDICPYYISDPDSSVSLTSLSRLALLPSRILSQTVTAPLTTILCAVCRRRLHLSLHVKQSLKTVKVYEFFGSSHAAAFIDEVLNWDLTPLTVNAWLNVYLQLASSDGRECFVVPDYPGIVLVKVAQLLDLCMLDVQALRFPYGIIAAAALYHTTNRDITLGSTGLEWSELLDCVEWMKPFAQTIREDAKEVDIGTFSNVLPEDQHNIQTHTVDLQLLEKALSRQSGVHVKRVSPAPQQPLLTPPRSTKKVRNTSSSLLAKQH